MGYPINWAPPEPDVPHATAETERYVILIEVWDTEQNDSFEAGWCVSSHRFTEWEHAKVYLECLSWRPGVHGDCYTRQRIGRGWGLLAILDLKTSEVHMMEDVLGHGFQEVAEGAVEEAAVNHLKRALVIPVQKYIDCPVEGDGIRAILGREEGMRRGLQKHQPEPDPLPPPPPHQQQQVQPAPRRVKVTWRPVSSVTNPTHPQRPMEVR